MKKHHNRTIDKSRREFLKKSILGAGAFFVSLSPLNMLADDTIIGSSLLALTEEEAKLLSQQAKAYFYRQEYEAASSIYQQILEAFPNKIQYYIDYGKVFGAQQQLLERAELFRLGLQNNSGNPFFTHRLGLSIRSICKGENKAASEFVSKYGVNGLYDYAAQLVIDAIEIKPNIKGWYFDLRDFQKEYDIIPDLRLSADMDEKVTRITAPYEEEWLQTRESRKPGMHEEAVVISLSSMAMMPLLTPSAIDLQRLENKKKAQKAIRMKEFLQAVEDKDVETANSLALTILSEDKKETNVVGLLRKLYKQEKLYDDLINFNYAIYEINPTTNNILSYCSSVIKYNENFSGTLMISYLNKITNYKNLKSVQAMMYYYCIAAAIIKVNNPISARQKLLTGINQIGPGNISYSLIEYYGISYKDIEPQTAINILKALSGEEVKNKTNEIFPLIDKYRDYIQQRPISIEEQLKPLYALASLQKTRDNTGYLITVDKIESLKAQKEEQISW